MRRTIGILLAVIILGGGGFYFWRQQQLAAAEPTFEILREAIIARDRITATVNATGSIEPEALVSLTFGMGGTIQQVAVVRGQMVAVGDVLATLDSGELELAVQQAEDALRIQQLSLQQRVNSQPSAAALAAAQADIEAAQAQVVVAEANVAGAEAAVWQAQAQRVQLLAGPTAGTVAAAESQVAQARLQQKNAEETHNRTMDCFSFTLPTGEKREECPGLGAPEEQARANLENANVALAAAETQLADLAVGPRAGDLQAADAGIASAQANVQAAQGNVLSAQANVARVQAAYDRLLESATADEIAILEAQVASAETNLALAQLRREQATIVAPIAGQVANVLINAGEQAAPGAPAMTIVNEAAFHITVNVDEIDIDRIAVGQVVDITLDALPDTAVTGAIAEIAPTSASSGGVVTYLVTMNIVDADALDLRAGMSANASIVVQEIEDVLVVPNWAVRLDRETGEAFVNLKRSETVIEEVVVVTGLRNELLSEVVSGLQAGDVVALTNEREVFSFFGGGGGN